MIAKHNITRSPQENPKTGGQLRMPLLRPFVFGLLVSFLPNSSPAEVLELSQPQLRQLVLDRQIHSAEAIVAVAVDSVEETPLDIRGFLSEGRMTYRLLIQRSNGSVVEILMNGQNGERISQETAMGRAVADTERQVVSAGGVAETHVSRQHPAFQDLRSGYPIETNFDSSAENVRTMVTKRHGASNGRGRNNSRKTTD